MCILLVKTLFFYSRFLATQHTSIVYSPSRLWPNPNYRIVFRPHSCVTKTLLYTTTSILRRSVYLPRLRYLLIYTTDATYNALFTTDRSIPPSRFLFCCRTKKRRKDFFARFSFEKYLKRIVVVTNKRASVYYSFIIYCRLCFV